MPKWPFALQEPPRHGHRLPADSPDEGVGDIRVADPDGVTFAHHTLNAAPNIDIIVTR